MGVCIYKTKGKFPHSFVMEIIDVLLMSRGEPSEVGYTANSEFIGDIIDLEYDEYSRGILHSHASMGVSPSGTDITQVKQWASTNPYYLSVIVNNNLDFYAMVAIKSTEKYKGYSFIKNLNGKEIKTPKEYSRESYEIIEVEVEADIPQYIEDVRFRINNRMQKYSYFNPKKEYISKGLKGYESRSPSKFTPALNKQTSMTFEDDVFEDFIEEALNSYCMKNGLFYPVETCAENIRKDMHDFQIPLHAYIQYLYSSGYKNDSFDSRLANTLQYGNN